MRIASAKFLVMIGLALFSCKSEEFVTIQKHQDISTTEISLNMPVIPVKDKLLEEFSKVFAASLKEKTLRVLLKDEALKLHDGDYDVFFKTFQFLPSGEGNLIRDFIIESYYAELQSGRSNGTNADEWLKALIDLYPNLQVSVPINIDKWDIESFIPPVTFLTDDFDEQTHKEIKAFDFEGTEFLISTVDQPDYPVVVISRSERMDENGNVKQDEEKITSITINKDFYQNITTGVNSAPSPISSLNVMHGSANFLILSWVDLPNESGYEVYRSTGSNFAWVGHTTSNSFVNIVSSGQKYFYQVKAYNNDGSSWSNIISTFGSGRSDGESLKMKRMRFTESALQLVESWTAGAPEIRIRIAVGSPTSATVVYTSSKLEPQHRNDIKDKWWNKEVNMLNSWNMGYHGTVLTMNFREEDWTVGGYQDNKFIISTMYEDKNGNSTIKNGMTVEITDQPSNDNIANDAIFWWQPKDMIYSQNGFSWQFVF